MAGVMQAEELGTDTDWSLLGTCLALVGGSLLHTSLKVLRILCVCLCVCERGGREREKDRDRERQR